MGHFETLLKRILCSPGKVAVYCAIFFVVGLMIDGSLVRFWSLKAERRHLESEIERVRVETLKLQDQIRQARVPAFIEKQARERFDMVAKDELVFVFSSDEFDNPDDLL